MRASTRFPLTAVGDVNTYALFAELDRHLINPQGRAGIIVPTGIATDDSTKAFFGDLVQTKTLASLYDFENREKLFAAVDSRMKFALVTMGETKGLPIEFAFFATRAEHLKDEYRVFNLSTEDIALLNPNTRTCPVFRTALDAQLTKKIYQRVPVLINETTKENPWGVSFMTMFHMSNDSDLFKNSPAEGLMPLYEAKYLHQFTHRWATFEATDARDLELAELQNPAFSITPRYYVEKGEVEKRLENRWNKKWLLGFRRFANPANERSSIFVFLPKVGIGDSIFIPLFDKKDSNLLLCFAAVTNCIIFDYVTRQKVGGINFNFYKLMQLPVLPPAAFSNQDIAYISERVLELVYTAWDMQPFGADVWAELETAERERVLQRWQENWYSFVDSNAAHQMEQEDFAEIYGKHSEYYEKLGEMRATLRNSAEPPPPFIWQEERRAHIRAELDAKIARLYGLTRDELRYILDPAEIYGAGFPGETFRVLKEKEIRQYGEYRTRRLVLEKWDKQENL